ncbi:aladin WD repeat nucleoporin isoform X2 [Rhodnius prolixus]|uniref:aladin WD repeat nucleoporin isoform X2 n=1 Tax=Rhodnius prolixus TaxID=13249 RepID=UPI003D18E60A
MVSDHPKVVLNKDVLHHSTLRVFAGQVFLPGSDSLVHRIQDAWYENGAGQVLQVLSEREDLLVLVKVVAKYLLSAYTFFEKTIEYVSSSRHVDLSLEDSDKFNEPVVCMNWHPECSKLALATRDDTVTLFCASTSINPILKAKSQRKITCVAWRPLTSGELAVGCSEGVYVWNMDPTTFVTRPAFSSAIHLPFSYVTNLAWSPQGDILIICNSQTPWMLAWEIDTKRSVVLKKVGGGGVSFLSWSHDGSKLLAATNTKLLRVWDTSKWTCENWWTAGGSVNCACWSQNGATLLFTTNTEPYIYSLPSFSAVFTDKSKRPSAYMVADLTRVQLPSGYLVGGEVKGMAWDRSNRRLALIFKDSPLIAVFYTCLRPKLQIYPGFFIKGLVDEMPSFICFQNNFTDGANLTICWSNGRVQYFPMIFRDAQVTVRANTTNFSTSVNSLNDYSYYYTNSPS